MISDVKKWWGEERQESVMMEPSALSPPYQVDFCHLFLTCLSVAAAQDASLSSKTDKISVIKTKMYFPSPPATCHLDNNKS